MACHANLLGGGPYPSKGSDTFHRMKQDLLQAHRNLQQTPERGDGMKFRSLAELVMVIDADRVVSPQELSRAFGAVNGINMDVHDVEAAIATELNFNPPPFA